MPLRGAQRPLATDVDCPSAATGGQLEHPATWGAISIHSIASGYRRCRNRRLDSFFAYIPIRKSRNCIT